MTTTALVLIIVVVLLIVGSGYLFHSRRGTPWRRSPVNPVHNDPTSRYAANDAPSNYDPDGLVDSPDKRGVRRSAGYGRRNVGSR